MCAEADRKVEEGRDVAGEDGELDNDGEMMDTDKPHPPKQQE